MFNHVMATWWFSVEVGTQGRICNKAEIGSQLSLMELQVANNSTSMLHPIAMAIVRDSQIQHKLVGGHSAVEDILWSVRGTPASVQSITWMN